MTTRSQLVERLASSSDISERDADIVLSTVIETISDALTEDQRVELCGFGTFSSRERPARQARNPRTAEWCCLDD